MEEIDVHLFLVCILRAVVFPDEEVGHGFVIDPIDDFLFEDAAALVQGDAAGILPFVFVENIGVETHGQAERFEKRQGLSGEHGVVPCA